MCSRGEGFLFPIRHHFSLDTFSSRVVSHVMNGDSRLERKSILSVFFIDLKFVFYSEIVQAKIYNENNINNIMFLRYMI